MAIEMENHEWVKPETWRKLRNTHCPKCGARNVLVRKSEIHIFKCRGCGNEFD